MHQVFAGGICIDLAQTLQCCWKSQLGPQVCHSPRKTLNTTPSAPSTLLLLEPISEPLNEQKIIIKKTSPEHNLCSFFSLSDHTVIHSNLELFFHCQPWGMRGDPLCVASRLKMFIFFNDKVMWVFFCSSRTDVSVSRMGVMSHFYSLWLIVVLSDFCLPECLLILQLPLKWNKRHLSAHPVFLGWNFFFWPSINISQIPAEAFFFNLTVKTPFVP